MCRVFWVTLPRGTGFYNVNVSRPSAHCPLREGPDRRKRLRVITYQGLITYSSAADDTYSDCRVIEITYIFVTQTKW